jgi:hypothetical protein
MATKPPAPSLPANPATVAQARLQMILGGVLAFLGVLAAALGTWMVGLVFIAGGALVLVLGTRMRRFGGMVVVVNRSLDAITRGRLAEAEALIDGIDAPARATYLRRVLDVQRSLIAFRRGDVALALQHADVAVNRPLGLVGRALDQGQRAAAQGMRALLRAMHGDEQGAREDAAEVRRCAVSGSDSLARAELAEAILLERSGDREALRKHLTVARGLLLEHSAPRERAVVRAYQRMLEARRSSIYREGTPRDPEHTSGDEPTIADWMAAVVPGAAPFVRARAASPATVSAAATVHAEPIDPEARRTAEARVKPARAFKKLGRLLALYLVLIGFFLAIWQFLSPPAGRVVVDDLPPPPVSTDFAMLPIILSSIALAVALVALIRLHAQRRAQRVVAALSTVARGEEERGEAELRALAKSRYPLIAGRAWLELAGLADRRADFAGALVACDRGLAALSSTAVQAVASSFLLPELVTERALVLAATDRDAEAAAEMALLMETYPAYPFRSRAELRVGLVRR